MSTTILAWHFVGNALRDGSPVPADGYKLTYPGAPIPCVSGLHASIRPSDALSYAPGETLCLVQCGGIIKHHGGDKLVCTERTILARMDATPLLRYYARMQALSVVHLIDTPPQVILDYLRTGDESIMDDARAAARASARASARDDARAAARAAAWAAAWDAARAAASEAASAQFDALVVESFGGFLPQG